MSRSEIREDTIRLSSSFHLLPIYLQATSTLINLNFQKTTEHAGPGVIAGLSGHCDDVFGS